MEGHVKYSTVADPENGTMWGNVHFIWALRGSAEIGRRQYGPCSVGLAGRDSLPHAARGTHSNNAK